MALTMLICDVNGNPSQTYGLTASQALALITTALQLPVNQLPTRIELRNS
jgi:hypothetical protein